MREIKIKEGIFRKSPTRKRRGEKVFKKLFHFRQQKRLEIRERRRKSIKQNTKAMTDDDEEMARYLVLKSCRGENKNTIKRAQCVSNEKKKMVFFISVKRSKRTMATIWLTSVSIKTFMRLLVRIAVLISCPDTAADGVSAPRGAPSAPRGSDGFL